MRTRKGKKIKLFATLIVTVMISVSILNANYVKPEINDHKVLTVKVDTKEQTFDEALLIGLQLLDQSDETIGYGKIVIDFEGEKYTAVVSLNALKNYDERKTHYALFIRNNVKFI